MGKFTIDVSDDNFDELVLGSDVPVVVDFWATWCGPCKAIAPMLEQAAEASAGSVTIAKVDVTPNRVKASEFGVRNIPCLVLFKDGKEIARHVGSLNRTAFDAFLAKAN